MSNDDAIGGFLGLVTLGAAFFLGNKVGQHKANRFRDDQERDKEINELKKQIAYLQLQKGDK